MRRTPQPRNASESFENRAVTRSPVARPPPLPKSVTSTGAGCTSPAIATEELRMSTLAAISCFMRMADPLLFNTEHDTSHPAFEFSGIQSPDQCAHHLLATRLIELRDARLQFLHLLIGDRAHRPVGRDLLRDEFLPATILGFVAGALGGRSFRWQVPLG